MADTRHEAWITGVGIVSSLGEGPQAHCDALDAGRIVTDATRVAPYVLHPLVPIDFDRQISKKGDQRQMETWQRIGVYAAGLALDEAGVKGNADILSRMDLIVAAGGGERDIQVDEALINALPKANRPDVLLNERLMSDLRPTLFLAQLSNLLAGNISIVHGVTGSSRTFMGEEQAGVDAMRIALARIASGQSKIGLVGGAYNSERPEMILLYEFARLALKEQFLPVWQREQVSALSLGSMGAFLVVEAREHAEARGKVPLARLTSVASDWRSRAPGSVKASLRAMHEGVASRLIPERHAILSGATGVEPATGEERSFLREQGATPARATGTYLGHGMEAQFPMNVALASLAVSRHRLFDARAEAEVERGSSDALGQVVVTSVGHWRGEGLALVESVDAKGG